MAHRTTFLFVCLCALAVPLAADPIPVRHIQGTLHAFFSLKDLDGHALAVGDLVQVSHGTRVTQRLTFHFRDGSLDDETTVYTQHTNFQLISDHHIQRGPSFPKPIDVSIDAASGTITSVTTKDGKPDTKQDHLDLPPDLANGLTGLYMLNLDPGAPSTRVSMIAPGDKPRLVHILITPDGDSHHQDRASIGGSPRTVTRYLAKIEIGGIAGAVAPIVGKQPADMHIWILPGPAPTLVRQEAQLFEGGPIWRIEQLAPALITPTPSR